MSGITVNSVSHRARNALGDAGVGVVVGGAAGLAVGKIIGHTGATALKGAGIGAALGIGAFVLADDAISSMQGRAPSAVVTGGLGALTGVAAGAGVGAILAKTAARGWPPGVITATAIAGGAIGGITGAAAGAAFNRQFPGSSDNVLVRTGIGVGSGAVAGAALGGLAGLLMGGIGWKAGMLVGAITGGVGGAGYGALNVD